jgi:hypothetical protein
MKIDPMKVAIIGAGKTMFGCGIDPRFVPENIQYYEIDTPTQILSLKDNDDFQRMFNQKYGELEKQIFINEKKYKQVERKFINQAEILSLSDYNYQKEKSYPNINLITEFELITNKKSKLSKSLRDYVVTKFNEKYIEID